MIIYTVYAPQHPAESLQARAESAVFVKEGFTIWGFLFGPLWLLYNRLWFEFIAAILVAAGVAAGLVDLGLKDQAPVITDLLLALIIGFEGYNLLRWRLQRKGYVFLASVAGRTRLECERRFFDAWLASAGGRGGASATPLIDIKGGGWHMPHIVGSWPEATA